MLNYFDVSGIGCPFNENLFAENTLPFAAYLEPDGLSELTSLKKAGKKQHEKWTPLTYGAAKKLLYRIPQRWKWGLQLPDKRWTTIQSGKVVRSGNRQWTEKSIGMLALLKHFGGRSFSCGACDAVFEQYTWIEKKHIWLPNLVRCLRWDIDQDDAWQSRNTEAVIAPLKIYREVLRSLGLPINVYSTGGRGVQAVIALPRTVPHMIASLMESIIITAIDLRMPQGHEGSVDKTALRSIMRLPGGLHAKTGRLGAWIDIDLAKYYPLEHQIELIGNGFSAPNQPGIMSRQEFQSKLLPISSHMLRQGIRFVDLVDLADSIKILEQCSDSQLASALLNLLDQGGGQAETSSKQATAAQVPQSAPRSLESQTRSTTPPQPLPPFSAVRQWAKDVWTRSFVPGGFYGWISMDGEKGILAARVLFGELNARQQLLQMAHDVPCRSSADLADRVRVIEAFYSSFHFTASNHLAPTKCESAPNGPLAIDPRIAQLAQEAIKTFLPPSGKPRWNTILGERLLSIVLQGILDSDNGFFVGSIDALVRFHNATWTDSQTNRQRVAEMLRRFCKASPSIKPLLYRLEGNHAASEPDMYRCGPGLSDTWLYKETQPKAHHWLLEGRWDSSDNEV